jgi:hypothetical protein
MEFNKSIAPPGYLLAVMLFLLPLGDFFTTVYPFRFGEERWRFGAVGSLGNVTLLPLLGLFTALVIAAMLDHRRVRRAMGWVCLAFAVLFGIMIVLFMLDFFQMRGQVKPQFQKVMDVAATGSLIKQVLTLFALILLSRLGMSGRGKSLIRETRPEERTTATPLLTRPGAAQAE